MQRTFLGLCALIASFALQAQIPNPGFEEWTTQTGMNEPVGWRTMNFMSFNGDLATQEAPGSVGDSFIRLHVIKGHGGVVSNSLIFTAGAVDDPTGFPYAQRPTRLEGSYRFIPQGAAVTSITVVFYRWDAEMGQRISVGGGGGTFDTETVDWSTFQIPIVYFDPLPPDTGYISLVCGASGAQDQIGTSFDLDDLQFQGLSTEVPEYTGAFMISAFPSPATDQLWWSAGSGALPVQWRIISQSGQLASEGRSNGMPIDVRSIVPGLYMLQLTDRSHRTAAVRFVKE